MQAHQYTHTVGAKTYGFCDLKDLMAKATPERSGDRLTGVAAHSAEERAVAQMAKPGAVKLGDQPVSEVLLQPQGPAAAPAGSSIPM